MTESTASFVYSDLGCDPELGELVELFVAELPGRLENLQHQFDAGNRRELCRAVHQMKGAAGSYGFHDVTPLAAQLEQSLKGDGPDERIQAELAALLELCGRLRAGVAR